MRLSETRSGNSITQGPHQVAQTLTSRSFFASPCASAFTPARVDRLQRDRLLRPLLEALPSTQARLSDHLIEQPKTLVVCDRHRLAGQHRLDRVAGVGGLRLGRVLVVVDAPDEAQLARRVEDEHVRRRHRPVLAGHRLRLAVVEVGEGPAAVLGAQSSSPRACRRGPCSPARRAAARAGRSARRARAATPRAAEVGVQLRDPLLVGLRRRAVVGREDDHQHLRLREARERVALPVDAGQVEVRGGGADRQRRDRGPLGGGRAGGREARRERRARGPRRREGVGSW